MRTETVSTHVLPLLNKVIVWAVFASLACVNLILTIVIKDPEI